MGGSLRFLSFEIGQLPVRRFFAPIHKRGHACLIFLLLVDIQEIKLLGLLEHKNTRSIRMCFLCAEAAKTAKPQLTQTAQIG